MSYFRVAGCFDSGRISLIDVEKCTRKGTVVKVAIPRSGESVAPCFGYCANMAIFTIANGSVVDQIDFPLRSQDPLDRIRLLRDQEVNTIICGGVQDIFENSLRANGIEVISWVSGEVDGLLELFLRRQLVASDRRRDRTSPPPDTRREC